MGYISGAWIRELRKKRKMTQRELALRIRVSDKTVSKWETGRGLPDPDITEELASALGVASADLLSGACEENDNPSANMQKLHFYVCPVCGNLITAVGTGSFFCCGKRLKEQKPNLSATEEHKICVEPSDVEGQRRQVERPPQQVTPPQLALRRQVEYLVTLSHEMTKKHFISFLAYVTSDHAEVRKLYPEQEISARFLKKGHGFLYAYCSCHGLFRVRV